MISLNIFGIVLLAASLSISSGQRISPRMMGGAQIDTMKRFPSSVNIQPINAFGAINQSCSGSILNDQWILTSADCVREDRAERMQININKLYANSTSGSYSVIVNNDDESVIVYPTNDDDLALIKLPVRLIFTKTVKPIAMSRKSSSELFNKLAVSPGFDENSGKQELTYSMLTVIPHEACEGYYSDYDKYQQLCVKAYRNYRNTPCSSDSGTALITDWPIAPKLIGVMMARPNDCDTYSPSVYLSVSKYLPWIESIIGESYPITSSTTSGYAYEA